MGKFIDLSNRVFGYLTIIERLENNKQKKAVWGCKCKCGKYHIVSSTALISGTTLSCGCKKMESLIKRATTHGMASVGKQTSEYRAWLSIKERCLNTKSKAYKYYGGRGILMFKEWENDFMSFYNYIGCKPTPKHSIDRFPNNDGNYEPGNVRWATQKQQCSNQRKTVNLTHNNITNTLSEWARLLNIKHEAIRFHLKKGRTISQIIHHLEYKRTNNIQRLTWKQSLLYLQVPV